MQVPESYIIASKGSFYLWSIEPYTKHGGAFFRTSRGLMKVLDHISIPQPFLANEHHQAYIRNLREEDTTETIWMQYEGIHYTLSKPQPITIWLDVRKHDDYEDWGRDYEMSTKKDHILVTYTKRAGDKHDYTCYIAIKAEGAIEFHDEFKKRQYAYDAFRGSDAERHVFRALTVTTACCDIGFGWTPEEAFRHAARAAEKPSYNVSIPHINAPEIVTQAWKDAWWSFEKLRVDDGIYAGYPWFYQTWTRDELISMVPLLIRKDATAVKALLTRYTQAVADDGKLFAMLPARGNLSADAAGWLAARCEDASVLDMPEDMTIELRKKLAEIESKTPMKENMVYSGRDQTWMDTSYEDDGREGFCLEIQALHARLLRVLGYGDEEARLVARVREQFVREGKLADHLSPTLHPDMRQRPNIFIAAYVYPWMFNREEWEPLLDAALHDLWLDWGGIASLSVHDPRFVNMYSGENNKSYHRGDSWWFLNCMAAIVLRRINTDKYLNYIEQIIAACIREADLGVKGAISEISSAKMLSSYGCLSQAWSNAMFIELCWEMYGK